MALWHLRVTVRLSDSHLPERGAVFLGLRAFAEIMIHPQLRQRAKLF